MDSLWELLDTETAFLALAVLLLASSGLMRRGLHWLLTEWLGLTQTSANRLTRVSIAALWLVLLILFSVFRAGT